MQGHCLDVLKALKSESAHCVVTSPPYLMGTPIVRNPAGNLGRRARLLSCLAACVAKGFPLHRQEEVATHR